MHRGRSGGSGLSKNSGSFYILNLQELASNKKYNEKKAQQIQLPVICDTDTSDTSFFLVPLFEDMHVVVFMQNLQ